MEKYWELSQRGETRLQGFPSPFDKQASVDVPEEDLHSKHQVKRPSNEGTWAGKTNLQKV